MSRVILHSDDLGVTRQSTSHLVGAWRAGHLDGFSIIVNGDAAGQIPVELAASPELPARLAVHFNLTEGRSCAAALDVPLLVDTEGNFRHGFGSLMLVALLSSLVKRQEFFRQIACECAAQITAARSLCGTRAITAIDGHTHVHMIPGIFASVARTARDAGIPEIRISAEPFYVEDLWRDWCRPFLWGNLIKHFLLNALSFSARGIARRTGLRFPGAFIGVLYTGRMSVARALGGISAAVGEAEIEVLFHIGRASTAEAGRWRHPADVAFHLSEWRDFERQELAKLAGKLRGRARDGI